MPESTPTPQPNNTPDQPSPELTRRFLELLYGDAELGPQQQLVLWPSKPNTDPGATKPTIGGRVSRFTELNGVALAAHSVRAPWTSYYVVGLQGQAQLDAMYARRQAREQQEGNTNFRTRLERTMRGGVDQITAIPGLWLDIDYGTEGHLREGLPEGLDGALRIVDALPEAPTMVVHTGGGVHCYWLFNEVLELSDDATRKAAHHALYGWTKTAQEIARQQFDLGGVDNTHSLGWVLRLPGTPNHKHGGHVVSIIRLDETRRYELDAFEPYSREPAAAVQTRPLPGGGGLDWGVTAPADLLATSMGQRAELARTWERARDREFDSDPSRYDLALAGLLVAEGWDDGDVLAALIQFRREQFPQTVGTKDPQYYQRTLAIAHGGEQARAAGEALEAMAQALDSGDLSAVAQAAQPAPAPQAPQAAASAPIEAEDGSGAVEPAEGATEPHSAPQPAAPAPPPTTEEAQALAWQQISVALTPSGAPGPEVQLTRLVEYPPARVGGPPTYVVTANEVQVDLGPGENVASAVRFANRVGFAVRRVLPKLKGAAWDRVLNMMLRLIEVHAEEEAPGEGVRQYVERLLDEAIVPRLTPGAQPPRQDSLHLPDGRVGVNLRKLWQFMRGQGEQYTQGELRRELEAAGAYWERVDLHWAGERNDQRWHTTRKLWFAPWIETRESYVPWHDGGGPE